MINLINIFRKYFIIKNTFIIKIIFLTLLNIRYLEAGFFKDISYIIDNNYPRLSYGIAVTDINNDDRFDFIVTGYQFPNLALSYKKGILKNILKNNIFADLQRQAIGIAACDIDTDGLEELYILNTDTFSGKKKHGDRLLDIQNDQILDLFENNYNKNIQNLTAGRSVACVDREGNGKYSVYISNYGGPSRLYRLKGQEIIDDAPKLNIDKVTGGRAVVVGHILSDFMDIFASNERGPNFLYKNINKKYINVAKRYGVEDRNQNGRGTVLTDILYRGRLDIISGNWQGYNRIYIFRKNKFLDLADPGFNRPSKIRTIIAADFDNDGYDEVFINNIGQSNKLFKIKENGILEEIDLKQASLPEGFGTGAAVADIDGDGVLELLISHGEGRKQALKLFKANINRERSYLRIRPINSHNAPARGATVTLKSNLRVHSKTIDAGSGYLCQMEPVAHFGIRKKEKNIEIIIKWTDGKKKSLKIDKFNKEIKVKKMHYN